MTDDELEIFFATDRDGGALDIDTATRASRDIDFQPPHRVDDLSQSGDGPDWPVWISPDRCTLMYIQKDNIVNGAFAHLRVATRSPQ